MHRVIRLFSAILKTSLDIVSDEDIPISIPYIPFYVTAKSHYCAYIQGVLNSVP